MYPTRVLIALFTVSLALPGAARAQAAEPTGGRWAPWFGCWVPAARSGSDAGTQRCIVPVADGHSARMVTFAGDRIVLDETVRPDGLAQSMTEKECSGQRESRWAQAGPRLFVSSTLSCAGQPAVTTTGLSALVTVDEWLDVQVATANDREQVRTRRFWRSSTRPPAPVADALRQLPPARLMPTSLTLDDVIEASARVAPTGVEAWIAESAARLPVDRRALVRLADAHVGRNVIDLMVALAYPKKFEVQRSSSSSSFGGGFFEGDAFDTFGPAPWGALADMYGLGLGAYGMSYYYLGGNGAYLPGGYAYIPAGGGGGAPAEQGPHGQVVNGQGYTRVKPREVYRGAASAQGGSSQNSGGGAESAGGGSSGGSVSSDGGASPAGYSGGGGGSTGLTAVPR